MKTFIRSSLFALVISAAAVSPRAENVPESYDPYSQGEKEYAFELLRYLYRWYLDDDLFILNPGIKQAEEIEFWIRSIRPEADENDKSRYIEVLLPIIQTEVIFKKADYEIPELGLHIQNDRYKVSTVDRYVSPPAAESEYVKIRYDKAEALEYLYETRNERAYPDEALQLRVDAALHERMGAEVPDGLEGDQLVYLAPVSLVSNEFWVFWENARKIIRFSSDADLNDPEFWISTNVGVDIYDLDHDIVISLIEKQGSNAFITKDAVGRILFNCVVLGKREAVTAEQVAAWKEAVRKQKASSEKPD